MSNQINLSGPITKVFDNKKPKPTTDFAIRTKRFNSSEFDEVVCSCDTQKIGVYLKEGELYDLQGYLKTDNWAVEKLTGKSYSYDEIPKGKDGRIAEKDKEKYEWRSRLVCVVIQYKLINKEVIKDRIEHAKAIMSGSVTF
jgi:hypothetical protein